MSRITSPRIPALFLLLAVCSCKDEEIRTYRVAVDPNEEAPASVSENPHSPAAAPEEVIWKAPEDWKTEEVGQFLTAAYSMPGGGRVTVSKLGGDGGGLTANVNRWRGQVGMEPLPENEVAGKRFDIAGSDKSLLLFNLVPEASEPDSDGILAAVLPLDSETWYFKFTAKAGEIEKGSDSFVDFLGSVRLSGGEQTVEKKAGPPDLGFTVPEGWERSEGSAMRAASFSIPGPDGTSADVSVIPLPTGSGSVLDNVNRWRGQVSLEPLDSADDPELGKKDEGPSGPYFISHMVSEKPILDGKNLAISAAILERPELTWFFKITGEADIVTANREKFEQFVKSAKIP